jgi:ComEC/Rec2-related protein
MLSLALAAGVARHAGLILLVACGLLARSLLSRRGRGAFVVLALVACACGALGWSASRSLARDREVVQHTASRAGAALVALTGTVAGFPQTGLHGTSFEFATVVEGRRLRLQVHAERFDVAYGDRYALRARLLAATPSSRRFLDARGLAGSARVRAADVMPLGRGGDPLLRGCFWPAHRFARTRLSRAMGSDAGLAIGMLLGERGQIDAPVRDAVRRLGIIHLLAISGMHLTTLAACVVLVTRLRPRRRTAVLVASLTVYAATVGDVESLTRAYLMALFLLAAHALVRPMRALDALGRTLFVMAVAAPLSLRSVGLQLSFAATFAVLACLPLVRRARIEPVGRVARWTHRALRAAGGAFVLSVAVELFIAPLQLHHFRVISVPGPVATVIFFLPVTVVLLGAVPVIALSAPLPASEWPGAALIALSNWTTDAMLALGRLAPPPVALPEPNPWLYYGALLFGWRGRRRPWAWVLAAAALGASFLC